MILQIAPENRSCVAPLFAGHQRQRVLIDAVFDHSFGTVVADSETEPEIAVVQIEVFTLVGGDPDHKSLGDILEGLKETVVIPESDAWETTLAHWLGEADRGDRWGLSHEKLDIEHLRSIRQQIPDGYEIRELTGNRELMKKGGGGTAYTSESQLLEHGIGFCVIWKEEVVATALSLTNSKTAIEITIGTDKPHRRKGLAAAVGSALIVDCLEREIQPHWNAANPESVRLAKELGYIQNDYYRPFRLGQ